jgi:hypothetical protein
METIYIKGLDDKNPKFLDFLRENPGVGGLKVRAYGANEAIPISGLKIVVSINYNDYKFIFFDGETDNSGMIEKIELPTPKYNMDDLVVPKSITYLIDVKYALDNSEQSFNVNMYDGVCVLQNISITPNAKEREYGN